MCNIQVKQNPTKKERGCLCTKYYNCLLYTKCIDIAITWMNFDCTKCPLFVLAQEKDLVTFIVTRNNKISNYKKVVINNDTQKSQRSNHLHR